jgi:acetylornithine deacetylase
MITEIPLCDLRAATQSVRHETESFLCDLIRLPSLSGNEAQTMELAAERFAGVAEVERIPLADSILLDEDCADPVRGLRYEGRSNLRLRLPGATGGRSLLFNTHLDVVPASDGQKRPFDPVVEAGIVRGRGACDAKGQAATIFAAFAALRRLGVRLEGDLLAHLVVEEEVGGNGTLAMIRRGERADACIVMEPTEMRVFSSVRGAVWFRVICTGKPGHSGSGGTVSALKMATRVMEILEQYHARLLALSGGIPLFERYPNPMPITFGKLHAGNWPAAAPASAVLEGVLGFLPNKKRYQVMEEMRDAILSDSDEWLRDHVALEFMYRHDAHVLDPGHPLPTGLSASCREMGLPGEIAAMTASCDSWFYNNQLKIPTVVFGPGSLSVAHSREEQISLDDILQAALVLVHFAQGWCGRVHA